MIHIICALKCEAKPLIAYYHLKHSDNSSSFPLYIGQDKEMSLTISGVGKINAAAATAFTHVFLNARRQDVWLNIGVAGHKYLDIGEIRLGHKITDQANHHIWYPQIVCALPCQSQEVLSCDQLITDYESNILSGPVFEMETAGFYAIASRFASSELTHVIKVISDNQRQPTTKITESFINDLLESNLIIVNQILESLALLAKDLESPDILPKYYEHMIEQWRFTQAERNRLKSCLNRWHILCPDKLPMKEFDESLPGKSVLEQITNKLDSLPIRF